MARPSHTIIHRRPNGFRYTLTVNPFDPLLDCAHFLKGSGSRVNAVRDMVSTLYTQAPPPTEPLAHCAPPHPYEKQARALVLSPFRTHLKRALRSLRDRKLLPPHIYIRTFLRTHTPDTVHLRIMPPKVQPHSKQSRHSALACFTLRRWPENCNQSIALQFTHTMYPSEFPPTYPALIQAFLNALLDSAHPDPLIRLAARAHLTAQAPILFPH